MVRRLPLLLALLLVLLVIIALYSISLPRIANGPGVGAKHVAVPKDRIVYMSQENTELEMVFINPDKTDKYVTPYSVIPNSHPTWSHSKRWVAFQCYANNMYFLCLSDAEGEGVRRLFELEGYYITSIDWSADETKLAISLSNNRVYIIGAEDATLIAQIETGEYPRWSPMSDVLTITRHDPFNSSVVVIDTNTMKETILFSGSGNQTGFADWSPDGERLVFVCRCQENYGVYTARVDGSEVIKIADIRGDGLGVTPQWSFDGTHIAFSAPSDTGTNIYVADTQGSLLLQITTEELPAAVNHRAQWSEDSQWLLFEHAVGMLEETQIQIVSINEGFRHTVARGSQASW